MEHWTERAEADENMGDVRRWDLIKIRSRKSGSGKCGRRAHVCDVHACIMRSCLVPANNLKEPKRILIVQGFIHIIPAFTVCNKIPIHRFFFFDRLIHVGTWNRTKYMYIFGTFGDKQSFWGLYLYRKRRCRSGRTEEQKLSC